MSLDYYSFVRLRLRIIAKLHGNAHRYIISIKSPRDLVH